MSRYEHIRIFQCAYMLTIEIYKTAGNFNREFKYTLGEKLKNAAQTSRSLGSEMAKQIEGPGW